VIFITAVYARTLTAYRKAKYLLPLAAYHIYYREPLTHTYTGKPYVLTSDS